ncbi:LysR substrate-binding domain-containing protein [Methylobacterium radiodurans]|uniref:LysR family transcriptional regulator n=1 Tax=Methylobacterium radiodurans TaxID=2202828 RepID=A0A2U8VW63_9HYPH|nr:LysR substrate-binding domain-containing protein [Methylobacterium radiodurans]AWN38017.1 LysR family transcriptional regulator [Methylobacterium radiodurans]
MNVSGLSLRDLEYVVAVADEGHFGRAAERCNVSQPTLSVQVRKLETALGLVLFERSNRRVLMTAAGQAIVRQARAVLGEAQRLLALATEGRGAPLTGRLVLAAIQTLGPYYFPLVLRLLRQEFPLLSLALTEARTAEILDGLRDGRIDAALVSLPVPAGGLTVSPLFVEPFWLACPAEHPLAQGGALRARDIAGPDLLLLDEGNCLRDQTVAACGAGSSAGRHATSLETLRSMVAAGAGYTLLPALAVPAGPDPSGLTVTRGFDADGPGRTIALAWRSSDPRAAGLAHLAAFFRAHAPPATAACRDDAARPSPDLPLRNRDRRAEAV